MSSYKFDFYLNLSHLPRLFTQSEHRMDSLPFIALFCR